MSFVFAIHDNMLFKVDVPASIMLGQGKSTVYHYVIHAFSHLHCAPI